MIRKFYSALLGALAIAVAGLAQAPERTCASMEVLEKQLNEDPHFRTRLQQLESFTQQYEQQLQSGASLRSATVTIPVVVHVVYNTAGQNVSDAMIQDQLNVLNEDFRKMNADAANVPSVWTGLAADCQIQFCLAQRDPQGNPTTGIVRRQTSVASFSSNDAVKYTAQGGSNAWPSGQYLNLWLCNLGGGLLGYAQFPGGPAATDGVVCLYSSIPGGSAAPFNLGRTATHEVGHWLNLRHIWGDANCGNDLVGDTPTQRTSNGGCPAFPKVTCQNGPNGDMHMNYMDYTNDACMYMFTNGQSTRMNAVLAPGGARYSLTTSPGCAAPGGTVTCDAPAGLGVGSVTSNSAALSWGAVSSASSYNVRLKETSATTWISGSTSGTSINATGLVANASYEFQVQTACGSTSSAYSTSFYFSTSAAGSGSEITVGTGTGTVATHPYGTYYMDERAQYIITNAELTAAGYTAGSSLASLAFNVASISGQPMNAFTIKVSHTSATAFGSTSYLTGTNTTTVYSANYTAQTGWNTHSFSTPFTYNGTSNLLIDICFNNSSYTSNSAVYYSSVSAYRALYKQQDASAGNICTTTTGTRTYSRPNMRLAFTSGSREIQSLVELGGSTVSLYPNPAGNVLNLEYTLAEDKEVAFEIYNALGQLVYTENTGLRESGEHLITLDLQKNATLATMPNGLYMLQLIRNGQAETIRFVLAR